MTLKPFFMIGNRKKSGMSLIEVVVSVVLFTVIIMSATEIFKLVIDGQRSSIASQNVQESLKYFLEVMGKEIRMAQKSNGFCSGIPSTQVFATSTGLLGEVLMFRNYHGECVSYSLQPDGTNQRFQITRGSNVGFISPAKIRIEDLHFLAANATSSQPSVTVNLRAWALGEEKFKSEMTIQTTLTSRYYK